MNIILLLFTGFSIRMSTSQYIYMNVCSDNNCNSDCVSWIATNNQCTPCKNYPCSNDNPSSITTENSLTIYSDSSCNVQVPNTYKMPLLLNNNCYQLYLYGDYSPKGSYKAANFSIIIGMIICSFIILIILIYFLVRYIRMSRCCQKKQQSRFEIQNGIFIIDPRNLPPHLQDITYGHPIQPNNFNSAPPLPSVPYLNNFDSPPPVPSAPYS